MVYVMDSSAEEYHLPQLTCLYIGSISSADVKKPASLLELVSASVCGDSISPVKQNSFASPNSDLTSPVISITKV